MSLLFLLPLFGRSQEVQSARKIYPHHLKLQYAGGIGMFAGGAGYRMLKGKVEVDGFFGIVPKRYADENMEIFTLRGSWYPMQRKRLSNGLSWDPFYTGLQGSYVNDDDLILDLSTKYQKGYYGWTTAVHTGIFVGSRIIGGQRERLGFYAQGGTSDIEVISYAINTRALKPWDIFNLAMGFQFFLR